MQRRSATTLDATDDRSARRRSDRPPRSPAAIRPRPARRRAVSRSRTTSAASRALNRAADPPCGSRMLEGYAQPVRQRPSCRPDHRTPAAIPDRLRRNCDEFAMGSSSGEHCAFGPTAQPLGHRTRARRIAPAAARAAVGGGASARSPSARDTGGSIRQPAAHCAGSVGTQTFLWSGQPLRA